MAVLRTEPRREMTVEEFLDWPGDGLGTKFELVHGLIIEVLSPSNVEETWESIEALAGVLSLRGIVVIDSMRVEAQVYRRTDDGRWPDHAAEVVGPGDTLNLHSLGLDIPVAHIYRQTLLETDARGSEG